MSLFGKMKAGLKSVTNRVTGGYGELTLELDREDYYPGDVVKARAKLHANDELKVTKITANLQGHISARYKGDDHNEDGEPIKQSASYSDYSFKFDSDLCGETVLQPEEEKEFEIEIPLPDDLPISIDGDNIKNSYLMRVSVDVPWGKDINQSKKVEVLARTEDQSFERSERNSVCEAVLNLPSTVVKPGADLAYSLTVTPDSSLALEEVKIYLLASEFMPGKVALLEDAREFRRRSQEDDTRELEEEDMEVLLDWEDEVLDITVGDAEDTAWQGKQLSAAETLNRSITIPQDFAPTFRHDQVRHKVTLYVHLVFESDETIEFAKEITVS